MRDINEKEVCQVSGGVLPWDWDSLFNTPEEYWSHVRQQEANDLISRELRNMEPTSDGGSDGGSFGGDGDGDGAGEGI